MRLLEIAHSLFKTLSNKGGITMKDLEFDVILEEDELFEDSPYGQLVKDCAVKSISDPPKEFVSTKAELAGKSRKAVAQEHASQGRERELESYSPTFQRKVNGLCENAVEWCNVAADCGEWKYVYDLSKVEAKYFKPTIRALRIRMKDVIILVQEKQQKLTIEWGSNEA